MIDFIIQHYFLWKTIHIISVISWMAGMLYLPRLFVYHASVVYQSPEDKLLSVMEYRLLRYIMTPASIATWLFGLLTGFALGGGTPDVFKEPWFCAKFVLVIALTIAHHLFIKYFKKFRDGKNQKSHKFFRVMNEIPTVLMIFIVGLVIYKAVPFL